MKVTTPYIRFQNSIRQFSRPNFARNIFKKPENFSFQKKFFEPNNP